MYIEVINYLPRLKAPDSCVQFWIKQLNIPEEDTSLINKYQDEGYCSIHEIQADMKGYLYITKFCCILILHLFCNHFSYCIYIYIYIYIYKISSIT